MQHATCVLPAERMFLVCARCEDGISNCLNSSVFCWHKPWAVDRSGRGISWRTQRACLKQALDHSCVRRERCKCCDRCAIERSISMKARHTSFVGGLLGLNPLPLTFLSSRAHWKQCFVTACIRWSRCKASLRRRKTPSCCIPGS